MDWITTRRTDPNATIGTGRGAGPARKTDPGSPDGKAAQRRAAARAREVADQRRRLQRTVRDLRRAIGPVEQALMAAEEEVAELTRQLGRGEVYDDRAAATELASRHGRAKDRATELGATWEQLAEALQTAEDRMASLDAG